MTMTRKEAVDLAELLERTWRGSPRMLPWRQMLEQHCDFIPALAVYEQYRDTSDVTPTIAGFLATYRRHVGRVRTEGRRCRACDNTGMRSARQVIGGGEHNVVVACAECAAGIAAARVLTAIDEANAKTNAGNRQSHSLVFADPVDTDDGPVMSFAEYLTVLTAKANAGDTEAGQMLDVWQQNIQRGAVFR